jgi:hypothetical protein
MLVMSQARPPSSRNTVILKRMLRVSMFGPDKRSLRMPASGSSTAHLRPKEPSTSPSACRLFPLPPFTGMSLSEESAAVWSRAPGVEFKITWFFGKLVDQFPCLREH